LGDIGQERVSGIVVHRTQSLSNKEQGW
jgi:hypothetical protein